ncbi:MAG TPA: FAD-binding oxidoreductase [Bacteroidota bacterium]|nr:FAD-binding oxidoreductase [Bacteroidota bacterium]
MLQTYHSVATELSSLVDGECFFDENTRLKYSTAACWYRITPVCVVWPKHAEDVRNVVRFASEANIAVIPRGGGTGLAGQAVGMGIILDFLPFMNSIIRRTEHSVTVHPGIVLNSLNNVLASDNLHFPIDPASAAHCTIGGMIGTNAAGAHGLKYGATKDHIQSLRVVLSNGDEVTIGEPQSTGNVSSPFFRTAMEEVVLRLKEMKAQIDRRWPKVQKNSSGYNVYDVVKTDPPDFRKLIVGSEGTLAVVLEATLKVQPRPKAEGGLLVYFNDYETTVDATVAGLSTSPAAIELLDRTYFLFGGDNPLVDASAETMLYYEFEGESEDEVKSRLTDLQQLLLPLRPKRMTMLGTENQRSNLWNLRESVSESMNLKQGTNKASFIEDVTVPLPRFAEYVRGLRKILQNHGIEYSLYGHAGAGNIHCAPFVDLHNLDHYRAIDLIANEINELAVQLGGTLSGEHGDGFVRTPFLERLYGSDIYSLFGAIKNAFDPRNILNPGKIIGPQNVSILHDLALA